MNIQFVNKKFIVIIILFINVLCKSLFAGGFWGLPDIELKKNSDMPSENEVVLIIRDKALKVFIDEYKKNELEDKIKEWKQKYPTYTFKTNEDYTKKVYDFFFAGLINKLNDYFNLKVDEKTFKLNMKPVQYEKDLKDGSFKSMIDRRLEQDLFYHYDRELQRYYRDKNQSR